MNNPLRRVLQSLAVSLPLLLGPLGAQETPPDVPKPAKDVPDTSAGKPATTAPPADTADDAGAEENVSADNSLSFPVDI